MTTILLQPCPATLDDGTPYRLPPGVYRPVEGTDALRTLSGLLVRPVEPPQLHTLPGTALDVLGRLLTESYHVEYRGEDTDRWARYDCGGEIDAADLAVQVIAGGRVDARSRVYLGDECLLSLRSLGQGVEVIDD